MTITQALEASRMTRSEAEILLASLLGTDRSFILAHPEYKLSGRQQTQWKEWCARRKSGVPTQYITGVCEFYGRVFHVNRHVLIPRPSTEGLVELALDILRSPREEVRIVDEGIVVCAVLLHDLSDVQTIVDIGTGSGCIAVTLACELPSFSIIATDISDAALMVARENAQMLRVLDRIEFLCGDLLEPVAQRHTPFIIVSNPPYLSDSHGTQMRTYEPSVALQGGEGGTTVLRTLVSHARAHPWCRGIFLECEENQLCVIDSVCGKAPRIPRSSVCGDRRAVGR